ncbi:MAG: CoB--CoM heterodisulfide reductase iron-sulfur subunit B family protein [Deltaproteobacteria bacterium]|nr:CoB--CoM heterodisulfide reductase iron-sulfur subunit B family protein [Deltaproteobacteria bacterium]
MMKYAFFLGCTIPARSRNYELSARKVADKLDIELVDVKEFICCGFPIKASDQKSSEIMAAYNLCLAQEKNLDILTLCSSCGSALTEVAHHLSEDGNARDEVNEHLAGAGLKYEGNVKVRHLARVLFEDIGADKIKEHFQKELSDLKIAIHYGCHYLKPSDIYDGFDEVEAPRSLDELVKITGAKVIDYQGKKKCCGGPVLPVDENVALSVTKEKLDNIAVTDANAMCLVCPFCSVMYDSNQKSIESEYDTSYNLPVLYLTQLLGLAMGFDRKALGLNINVVKTKKLLSRYFSKE